MGWLAFLIAVFVVPMLLMAAAVWLAFRLVVFAVGVVFGVARGAVRLVVR